MLQLISNIEKTYKIYINLIRSYPSITMFSSTVELFDLYYRHLDAIEAPGFNRDLGCEIRERLAQLTYIVDRVQKLESLATEVMARSQAASKAQFDEIEGFGASFKTEPTPPEVQITKEEIKIYRDATFEMKLLTEAFYYFAGRIRTILRNRKALIPGLTNFECEGIRNTRNQLLGHAEGKDSQVSIQSFAWGNKQGPVLKAVRYRGQEHVFPDRGLYEMRVSSNLIWKLLLTPHL